MTERQNRVLGVVGRKGSGKSTRVAQLLRYCPRFFVFDPMEDHADRLPNAFDDLDEVLEFFAWTRSRRTFAGAYIPQGDLEEELEEICQAVYNCEDLALVVEEVPLVCKPAYLPPAFGRLVRTGRHAGIDLVWTAQRAAEVSRTLTSATDLWILYSQVEPRDLDALAGRCGPEIADRVAQLGLHDSFIWDVIAREIVPDSKRLLKREVAK